MAIQHEDITDPKIHEPKGISTASANTVYVANGAGSGAWSKLDTDNLDMASVNTAIQSDLNDGTLEVPGTVYLTGMLPDISTASSVLIPIMDDATVVGASVVLGGAITVADAHISFKNSAGAAMGTDVTVAFNSSAKGDQYAFTATGNNVLVGPTWIEVATDGASTDTAPVYFTIKLQYQINK